MRNIEQILPGTLCADISSRQMSAIELGISLGQKIQTDFPEIGNLYKKGLALSMLISKFNVTSHFGVNFKVAETAVYRALKGYDGYMKSFNVEPYSGLLSEQELTFFGKEHNEVSGSKVGQELFKQKKGIFAFTKEQQEAARKQSVIACNNIPYSQEELDYIEKLAADPQYQKGSLVKVFEISFEINLKFHNGDEVRKPRSISKIRLRKRISKEL
jgi:hypothetical protein